MSKLPDRRRRRSHDAFEAIGFQLQACTEDAGLDAMVVADEDGLCLAAAGPADRCGEIAAHLPILGRQPGGFRGVLLADDGGIPADVQRFLIDGSELYVCAIGGDEDLRARQIARSIRGCARILASV